MNTDKYHVHDSSSSRGDRNQKMLGGAELDGMKFDVDTRDGQTADANPEPKSPAEATAVNEDDTGGSGVTWQIDKCQSEEEGNQKERMVWECLFRGHAWIPQSGSIKLALFRRKNIYQKRSSFFKRPILEHVPA
jgi:hypothetical protein